MPRETSSHSGPIGYRRTTEADFEAQHAVFCRAERAVMQAHGYEWIGPPFERFAPSLRHFLAHDAERCWVAELDGRVVGYTAAIVRGDVWFFSALFIDPEAQGRGVGRRLLELALDGAPSRRLTITDAIQPISNALYGQHGLLPITPMLGMARDGRAPARATGDSTDRIELGGPSSDELARVDAAAYEFDRRVDHEFWGSRWERRGWYLGGELIAYSYRWPDGRIGPLAGLDPSSAAAALRAELDVPGPASIIIPGSSRSLLETALAAGLRLESPPGLLLASDGVHHPTSLAISTYGLY